MESIDPISTLELLTKSKTSLLDVRSEGEYNDGHLWGSYNYPILTNSERHQVGLRFKQEGQDSAIQLGHKLVDPYKNERIQKWITLFNQNPENKKIVLCWRGGLRSKIASEWLSEASCSSLRVQGGYKELRRELIGVLQTPPHFLVISGSTGSGKSELLRKISKPVLDLEGYAKHRGSAFGADLQSPQPSQQTFENKIALELLKIKAAKIFVEDESISLGSVHLPETIYRKISTNDLIVIDEDIVSRVERIYKEYILDPLQNDISKEILKSSYTDSLFKISKKLGGVKTATIHKKIRDAFDLNEAELHKEWIQDLLVSYYDPFYKKGREKKSHRKIIFMGSWKECYQWITTQFV